MIILLSGDPGDEVCMKEQNILQMVLEWGDSVEIPPEDMSAVLETVRFTKLTMEQFFDAINSNKLEQFEDGPLAVQALERGHDIHNGPMKLRRSATGNSYSSFI